MDLVNIYKKIIIDPTMSWVLFQNGTCVMLLAPEYDLQNQAIKILHDHGPVLAGTPSGDFEVTKIPEIRGWVVIGDFPGIMMYVSQEEGENKSDFEIGVLGREKRSIDASELKIIHFENKQELSSYFF